jgi:hypothetical protein
MQEVIKEGGKFMLNRILKKLTNALKVHNKDEINMK